MFSKMLAMVGFAAIIFAAGLTSAEDGDFPPVTYPALPSVAPSREALIPPGWHLEAEATGDLDADGRADLAIVVMQGAAPDGNADASSPKLPGPRMLIVGFGAAKGYAGIVSNHTLITRTSSPEVDDYFGEDAGGLSIEDGKLKIGLHFFASSGSWDMWNKTFIFKWNRNAFELLQFDWDNVDRGSGKTELSVFDYARNSLTVTTGTIESDEGVTKTSKLPKHPAITLDRIGDGAEFAPPEP